MTLRGTVCVTLMTVSGLLSAFATLLGLFSIRGLDFSQNPLLSSLYCLLPFLTFPVFLLVRPARRSAAILAVMSIVYLGVYSALNWRTCSELDYCTSVAATVFETMRTRRVVVMFAAALLSFIVVLIDKRSAANRAEK